MIDSYLWLSNHFYLSIAFYMDQVICTFIYWRCVVYSYNQSVKLKSSPYFQIEIYDIVTRERSIILPCFVLHYPQMGLVIVPWYHGGHLFTTVPSNMYKVCLIIFVIDAKILSDKESIVKNYNFSEILTCVVHDLGIKLIIIMSHQRDFK